MPVERIFQKEKTIRPLSVAAAATIIVVPIVPIVPIVSVTTAAAVITTSGGSGTHLGRWPRLLHSRSAFRTHGRLIRWSVVDPRFEGTIRHFLARNHRLRLKIPLLALLQVTLLLLELA